MELLQLRYFVTVARMLNISKAAEYHRIPQPAMSKTISKLEKELGVALFYRQNNRISLTDEGNSFYKKISQGLGKIDEAKNEIQEAYDIPHGEITLLVKEHRAYVIKCIAKFKKKYPNVRFRVFYDEKAARHYDFYIGSIPAGGEFNKSILLLSERMQLIVSLESDLSEKNVVTINDLRHREFAVTSAETYQWKSIGELCSKEGFVPKLAAEFGDIQCLAEYVELGMAVTLGPKSSYTELGRKLFNINLEPEINRPTFLFWNGDNCTKTTELFKESIINFFSCET